MLVLRLRHHLLHLQGKIAAPLVDIQIVALGFDDSLDVVGIHLVGGIVGTLFIGIFGTGVGLAFGNGPSQLVAQLIGVFSIGVYSFVAAWVIAFGIQKTIGFRVESIDEEAGIDPIMHGQLGYADEDPRWSRG